MKQFLFKFESFLLKNGIVAKEDIKAISGKTRQNNLITLSDYLKVKHQSSHSSKIASLIYDCYIRNDDEHIKGSIRRLMPIYARSLRSVKMRGFFNWKKFNRKRWINKQMPHINSLMVSNRLYEDYKFRWDQLRDLEKKYQSIEAEDCTFSPRINHDYRPKLQQSRSYSRISLMKIEDPPFRKRRSANNSMTDIFNNLNLIEKYRRYVPDSRHYAPDRSLANYPSYRIQQDLEPLKKQLRTISTTSNRDKDTMKTLLVSESQSSKLNLPSSKYDQSKARLLKGTIESTEEDTRKALKSKEKIRTFCIGPKETVYLPHDQPFNPRNANGHQITLQTFSDSKLLHLATHYITTDESFEKFKWNQLK